MCYNGAADFTLGVDTDGQGNFTTVAVLRAISVTLNLATISLVNDSFAVDGIPELLKSAAASRVAVQCSFKDETARNTIKCYFSNGIVMEWKITLPHVGIAQGLFYIAALEYSGQHGAEALFDLALQSAGRLIFSGAEDDAAKCGYRAG